MAENVPEHCEVCDEPMDPQHNAICAFCHRYFHLTWDTRLEIRDCGRFDIDENTLALYFTCETCAGEGPQMPAAQGGQEIQGSPNMPGFPGSPVMPPMPPGQE